MRVSKHQHRWQIVAHTYTWDRILVTCEDLSCHKMEARLSKKGVAPTREGLRHLCCEET